MGSWSGVQSPHSEEPQVGSQPNLLYDPMVLAGKHADHEHQACAKVGGAVRFSKGHQQFTSNIFDVKDEISLKK
jgi:hypothetical protein